MAYCTLYENGIIHEGNLTAARLLGVSPGSLAGQPITKYIVKADQDIYYQHRKLLFESGRPQTCELRLTKTDGSVIWASLTDTVGEDDKGALMHRSAMINITDRKTAEEKLKHALDEIKRLQGIIPICMHCKKIRNDSGRWEQLEDFISNHSEAEFSHSLCPSCQQIMYPELLEDPVSALSSDGQTG